MTVSTLWKISVLLLMILALKNTNADVIIIQSPQPNTTLLAGSTIPLSYRVSYQDISLLRNVTVELQDPNGIVIQSNIDTSQRPSGEGVWERNTTWTVPSDLNLSLCFLRVYGDASYRSVPDWKIQWVVRESKIPITIVS